MSNAESDGLVLEGSGRDVFRWGAFLAAVVCTSLLLLRLIIGPNSPTALGTMAVSALLFAIAPGLSGILERRTTLHAVLLTLVPLVVLDGWALGGPASPSSYALLVLPFLAAFSLGYRAGLAHATLCAVAFGVLYGVASPDPATIDVATKLGFAGACIGMLVFATGISTLYDTERQHAFARTAAVVENLGQGVIAVGPGGEVEVTNPAVWSLVGDELPQGVQVHIRRALENGAPSEGRVTLPNNRVVAVAATPTQDERGGAVAIIHDVTEDLDADRAATDFIRSVAVELRAPLTSVLGFARVTQRKLRRNVLPLLADDDPKVKRARDRIEQNLDIVVKEGLRLGALVDDLLDIAKLEAGDVQWEVQEVDPKKVVARTVDATRGLFVGDSVAMSSQVQDGLPTVQADKQRLLQVMINLVSNAAKFTEEGRVEVSASLESHGVQFTVSDTGPGIAPEHRDAIFERFRQAPTGHGKGTGLGLPICRQIIEAHGGRIWVDSEEGVGSQFKIWLPLELPEDSEAGASTSSDPSGP